MNDDTKEIVGEHVLYFGRNAAEVSIPPSVEAEDARLHAAVLLTGAAELVRCVGESSDNTEAAENPEGLRYACAGIEAIIRLALVYHSHADEEARMTK